MKGGAGALRERVAFDAPVLTPDGYGGETRGWARVAEVWAEFRYLHGREAEAPGGQTGTAAFKVCVRSARVTRELTTQARMHDLRRGVVYNLREVDAVSDPAFVWLVAESGVAV